MKRTNEKGSSILEFALSIVVVMAISMGAADFSRVFYHSITLVDAGAAGATFGGLRTAHSGRYSTMRTIATDSSSDVAGSSTVSVNADRYCDCPSAPATSPTHANAVSCTVTCTGYGQPRLYVRTSAVQNFRTVANYPLLPNSLNTGIVAYRRVQ
jgi:hypothetical protein